MNKSVEFSNRIAVVNSLGVKSPKVLQSKMNELSVVERLTITSDNLEYVTGRIAKLESMIDDIILTLENKPPKAQVFYGGERVLDGNQFAKRAVSYNRKVYEMHLLTVEFENRKAAITGQLSNIERGIPVAQRAEFSKLLRDMSVSDYNETSDILEEEEVETVE